MKAYIVRIEAQMEGFDCFCCDYGSCTPDYFMFVDLVVVDGTASKARYAAIRMIVDNPGLSDHESIGELMKSSSVRRTRRKYNYSHKHIKVTGSDAERPQQSDEEHYFGFM